MANLKPFSYSHVLTILIGFFHIALIFIVFDTARNKHDIIIYAILIYIYLEVFYNRIHSLWGENRSYRNLINILNKTRHEKTLNSLSFEDESEFMREDLHVIISYVFVTIMRLICLYYFLIAVLYEDY